MLSLSGADSPEVTAQIRPDRIEVETISINLDEKHPEQKSFGSLQLLSAIHLRSKDRRFGGLSGISFGTDGRLYFHACVRIRNVRDTDLVIDVPVGDPRPVSLAAQPVGQLLHQGH